jgi:hypothetical protein
MKHAKARWTIVAILSGGLLALGPCSSLLNTLQAIRAALTIVDALA